MTAAALPWTWMRARRFARGVATAVVLALATTSLSAGAAPREAQERFEEGRALVRAGKTEEAIPKFLASIAAEPTAGAVLNLADCYEKVGKLKSAHARFKQAYEMSKEADPFRANEARKRAELLEPRLSTVTLLPPARPESTSAWIDGEPVPRDTWGKPRPFDGGKHELVVQDVAGKRRSATIEVPVSGARLTVPLDVGGDDGAKVAPPPPKPEGPLPPPPSDGGETRTIAIVTGATGLVALGVGAVTGIIALGAKSDLDAACPAYPQCPPARRAELVDTDDRARTMGTVSTITIIAGAVLVVTGGVLWFAGAPSGPERTGRFGAFTF